MKDHTDKLAHALGTTLTVLCALFMCSIYADHPVDGKAYFELVNNTDLPIQFDKTTTGRTRMSPYETYTRLKEAVCIIPPHSSNKVKVSWRAYGPGGSYHLGIVMFTSELPWSDVMSSTIGSKEQIAAFILKLHDILSLDTHAGDTFKYIVRRNPDDAAPYYEILQPESVYESPERITARAEYEKLQAERRAQWEAEQKKIVAQRAIEKSLSEAAERGDIHAAEKLLAENPNININAHELWGTPLMLAAHYNRKEMAKFLVARGADLNHVAGDVTALNEAIWQNLPDMVKILLDGGANVNLINESRGTTALQYAVEQGNEIIVKLLLNAGADVYIKSKDGKTAFDYTRPNRNERRMRELLEAAAKKRGAS